MTTGEKIREIRKEKKLTQQQLGKLLGVSGSMIGQYEKGERNPKYITLQKIASVLGVNIEDIIGIETFETGADFLKKWNAITQQSHQVDREEQERLQQLTADFHKLNVHGQKEAVKRTSEMTRLPEFTEGRRMDIVVAHGADGKTTITDRKTGEKFVIDEEQDET